MNSINTVLKFARIGLILTLTIGAYTGFSAKTTFAQGGDLAAMESKAADLFAKGNLIDAFPLYEKLAAEKPNDARVHYNFAFALLAKANSTLDTEAKRQLRVTARTEFEKAKKLNISEPNINGLLDSLPADGAIVEKGFSTNQQAEKYMNDAEAKFAAGDMDGAFDLYQKALKIDPGIYEAALFSGDVMNHKDRFGEAEKWYMTASRINPFRETAYRYSATPLMKQGKDDEAKMRYIEAFITEPYNRLATGGMVQWAQAVGRKVGHPKMNIPANVGKSENGNIAITLGSEGKSDDGSFAWTAYGLSRALWLTGQDGKISENFHKAYPKETVYRHSLAEEYEGLKRVATTIKGRLTKNDSTVKNLDPSLALLVELYDKGLLESYILLARPDQGIARDHLPYLEKNRDKLRQYVVEYVVAK